ncbi:MAG: hypothetical protein SVG88_10360 [Halobacteriales archaeon]|nr:hypothetical protein [Halobacteriales archaeon]
MAPISSATFARRLRDLPPERLAAFVADLWAARGYETHIDQDWNGDGNGDSDSEGISVIVRRDGERQRLVCRHGPGRWRAPLARLIGDEQPPSPSSSADIVVTTASGQRVRRLDARTDARVIGTNTLRELLLYAIDPRRGDELCQAYLDRPARTTTDAETTAWTATSGGRVAILGAIALTVVILTGGIIGAPGAAGVFGFGAQSTPTSTTTPTTAPVWSQGSPVPTARQTPTLTPKPARPPGLSETGITDPEVLIDDHFDDISGHSYTLTITYRILPENSLFRGQRTIERQEVIRVRRPSRYVTNVSGDRLQLNGSDPTATVEAFGTDGFRYVKATGPNGTHYRRTPITYWNDRTRYAVRARVLFASYLFGNYSTSVTETQYNGEPAYILTLVEPATAADEDPTTVTAVIGTDGVIHTLQRRSTLKERDDVTVVVSLQYSEIGSTTVSPPPWYEAAKNATTTETE